MSALFSTTAGPVEQRLDCAPLDKQQRRVGEPRPKAEGRLAATACEQLRGQRARHRPAAVRRAEVGTVWTRELLAGSRICTSHGAVPDMGHCCSGEEGRVVRQVPERHRGARPRQDRHIAGWWADHACYTEGCPQAGTEPSTKGSTHKNVQAEDCTGVMSVFRLYVIV